MSKQPEFLPLDQPEISRRTLLLAGAAVVTSSAINHAEGIADFAGEILDDWTSPEHIITGPVPVLEPRHDNTPVVAPKPSGEPIGLPLLYERGRDGVKLNLSGDAILRAEHTGTTLHEPQLATAGTAVITTAEGLVEGKQEYCNLFKGKDQTVAVGYQGGLYIFEPRLAQGNNRTGGEWVRLVTDSADNALPSPVQSTTPWSAMRANDQEKMLIERDLQGTKTLLELGYKPWAGVLPSTEMPNMTAMTPPLSAEICATNTDELLAITRGESTKRYFITANGDIVDVEHLYAKAGETLDLYAELYYQHVSGARRPSAQIKYAAGSNARFGFSVDPQSLDPATLIDTTFSIMTTESAIMEGVAQRYVVEKIAPELSNVPISGMSAEDMFTNSLGIVGMLSLLQSEGFMPKIEAGLRELHRSNPKAPMSQVRAQLDQALSEIKPLLAARVVTDTAGQYGIALPQHLQSKMPRGFYPFVPTKVSDESGSTPTRIDLDAANIRTDNPDVKFHATHVPVFKSTFEKILDKVNLS